MSYSALNSPPLQPSTPESLLRTLRLNAESKRQTEVRAGPRSVRRSVPSARRNRTARPQPPPPPPQQPESNTTQPTTSRTAPNQDTNMDLFLFNEPASVHRDLRKPAITANKEKASDMDLFFFENQNSAAATPPSRTRNARVPIARNVTPQQQHNTNINNSNNSRNNSRNNSSNNNTDTDSTDTDNTESSNSCTKNFITFAVFHPCISLCLTICLPLLFSIIALSSMDLQVDVALSSFEVSNKHPVAMHADSMWNAQNSWQATKDSLPKKRRLNDVETKNIKNDMIDMSWNERSDFLKLNAVLSSSEDLDASLSTSRSLESSAYFMDRMELIFIPLDNGNVLFKEYLMAAREVETIITKLKNYQKFCWKPYADSDLCAPPNSLSTYFFPSRENDGTIRFDGKGNLTGKFEERRERKNHNIFSVKYKNLTTFFFLFFFFFFFFLLSSSFFFFLSKNLLNIIFYHKFTNYVSLVRLKYKILSFYCFLFFNILIRILRFYNG